MTIYQILALIGFPSIITALFSCFLHKLRSVDAIRTAVQAILRNDLYAQWKESSELGYAPISTKENFENMWKQYHALGKNGVMDDKRELFLALPDAPPKEE